MRLTPFHRPDPSSPRRRAPRPLRGLALVALGLGLATGMAWAQEEEPGPQDERPGPQDERPLAEGTDPVRATAVLAQLEALYPRSLEEPAAVDLSLTGKAANADRARFVREAEARQAALERMPNLAQAYRAAAGDGAVPAAWFYAGFARVRLADRVAGADGRRLLEAGVADLTAYLERAPDDAGLRPEAQRWLAHGLLRIAAGDEQGILGAAPHADSAVRGLLGAGRGGAAGGLAYLMLQSLVDIGREAQAASLAAGWEASTADFGPSTDSVRRIVRRTRVRPGAALPALPELDDCDGKPLPWAELAGTPYVLHFFSTVVSSTPREIETILVPLRDAWKEQGLRLIGCSIDRAMDDAELARTRKNWEEWGRKEPIRDGRLASVREWAEVRGVDWPWHWDGKWMRNALADHLGIAANAPFAIVVDAQGVIRWRGAPFAGLTEAVAEVMQPGQHGESGR